jgi:hypothetical protein
MGCLGKVNLKNMPIFPNSLRRKGLGAAFSEIPESGDAR